MKRYVKSTSTISQKYVEKPIDILRSMIGISAYYSSTSLSSTNFGKCNFVISDRYQRFSGDELAKFTTKLKSIGAKYITPRYGDIYFYYNIDKLQSEYEAKVRESQEDYNAQRSAMDVSQWKPTNSVLDKLEGYRIKGSKVNVKAIKDPNKLLTYYYGAMLMGWSDLKYDIERLYDFQHEYADELLSIAYQVKVDSALSDSRNEDDIHLELPDSHGLFTFETRTNSGKPSCWLPKKLLVWFINNDIPVHFGKRTSGGMYDHNGVQWSEVEHLALFPGSPNEFRYDIVVHTLESGGQTTYTGQNTGSRVSIQKVIDDIAHKIERNEI